MVFKKHDQNADGALSAKELAAAIEGELSAVLTKDEIETLNEFFKNKFRTATIKAQQFKSLMNTKFDRYFQTDKARRAINAVKKALAKQGKTPEALFNAQAQFRDAKKDNEVNIRTFKLAIFTLNCMNQQEINNLAKYMDRRNNGMIHVSEFNAALSGSGYSPQTISYSSNVKK